MDSAVPQQIANAVLTGASPSELVLIAVAVVTAVVATFVAAFLGGYAARRGQNLATKADVVELRNQLSENTKITEKIKAEVEYGLARRKEIETSRRQKLEEYFIQLYEAYEHLTLEMRYRFFHEAKPTGQHALAKASMIQRLYFPEMAAEHGAVLVVTGEFQQWIAVGMKEMIPLRRAGNQSACPSQETLDQLPVRLKRLSAVVMIVEAKGQELAKSLNATSLKIPASN